ncbi:MAG: 50S ribosomal protein L6 [Planctomycetota bacterium]
MSRIGKKIIDVPKGVTVTEDGDQVTVKGPKGQLQMSRRPEVSLELDGAKIKVVARDQERGSRAFQGTTRALLANMVEGVSKGFEKKLEVSGVGYQAALSGKVLELSLGFNKPVKYAVPTSVVVDVPNPTTIVITGCDKQQVGLVAASIRKLRKPEPYKGKGIKYSDEVVKRKAGKAFASGGG